MALGLFEIYLLNLIVTICMFLTLVFRAWIELKHFKLIWNELEHRRIRRTVAEILKAEKDLFKKVEGGEELYEILCKIFSVK
ncbi:MAG: hypothetical protein QW589_00905 [Candidatus Bathyarchaeia archaeon]